MLHCRLRVTAGRLWYGDPLGMEMSSSASRSELCCSRRRSAVALLRRPAVFDILFTEPTAHFELRFEAWEEAVKIISDWPRKQFKTVKIDHLQTVFLQTAFFTYTVEKRLRGSDCWSVKFEQCSSRNTGKTKLLNRPPLLSVGCCTMAYQTSNYHDGLF